MSDKTGRCLGFAESPEELADITRDASEGDWCVADFAEVAEVAGEDAVLVYTDGKWVEPLCCVIASKRVESRLTEEPGQ